VFVNLKSYIKKGIQYKIIDTLSFFIEKTFECLTIEIKLNGKKIIISNFYRPPTPPPGVTPTVHLNMFIENFENLLRGISSTGCESYVFSDTNINILRADQCTTSLLESALSYGFIQIIKKATRLCNNKFSLIDHIFTNANKHQISTGTIINDISDHFPTFVQLSVSKSKNKPNKVTRRDMSKHNMNLFRNSLSNMSWNNVISANNVDTAYENFWSDFHTLFEYHFPIKTCKFNKNFHKKKQFYDNRHLGVQKA
jgi:hypothetical protein